MIADIKASGSVAPVVEIRGLAEVPGFWLTLIYEDVAGKGWITKARYIATRNSYIAIRNSYKDVTINMQDEGVYGLLKKAS